MNVRNLTLAAAATLVVIVVGGVLLFAVPRPPPIPSLADDPAGLGDDPGRLAWIDWGDDGRCLVVADATGDTDRRCTAELDGEVVGWDGDEVVLRSYRGADRRTTVRIDVTTGSTRTASEVDDEAAARWDDDAPGGGGARLDLERDDGRLSVRVEGEQVWEVDAPDAYTITDVQRSADGQLVLLQDSARRMLVGPADGSAPPRVWLEREASWQPVVWDRATVTAADG